MRLPTKPAQSVAWLSAGNWLELKILAFAARSKQQASSTPAFFALHRPRSAGKATFGKGCRRNIGVQKPFMTSLWAAPIFQSNFYAPTHT